MVKVISLPNIFQVLYVGHVRSLKCIKYWIRILKLSNDRLPKICYRLKCKWLEGNPRTNCWVRNLRDLPLANGFGFAWYNQGVGNELNILEDLNKKEKIMIFHCGLWKLLT